MGTSINLVGEIYNTIEVIEYIGNNIFKIKCLECGNITTAQNNDIENDNIKSCQKCKSYKFNLETSREIFELYLLDNVSVIDLSDVYHCSKHAIRSAISRVEEIDNVDTGE